MPVTGSSSFRTSRRAGSTSSLTRSCRCCRSGGCSAPTTRAARYASILAWLRCAPAPPRRERHHEIPHHHPDSARPAPHHRRGEADHGPFPRSDRQRAARRGTGLRRVRGGGTARAAVHLFLAAGGAQPHRRAYLPDQAVHRRHHAEPARPGAGVRGLRDPRPPLRPPAELFNVPPRDQGERNAESYELFRQIWRNPAVTATPRFRPALHDAEVWPRPLQQPIRVWHGSATSKESVALAARYGAPLFSANVTNPIGPYAELVRYYRERWAHYGHDPGRAVVGAGTAGYYATRNSQDALAVYRPVFDAQREFQKKLGLEPVFTDLEDFVARSSALIGSPQQVIEKVHRYHEQFGHTVLHLHADAGGLTDAQHREALELFQSDIAPVLRRDIPRPAVAR